MMASTSRSELHNMGGYDYRFVESPPDELMCLICTFVAKDPQQLVCCGRIFCKTCLDTNRKRNSDKCPQCSKCSSGFNDTRSDRNIKSLKVMCKSSEQGCDWTGDLRSIEEHYNTCDYNSIQCPNHCSEGEKEVYLLQKNLQDHLKTCPKRQHQCPHCKEMGDYQDITRAHLRVCPKVQVPCGNAKCKKLVPRCQLMAHHSSCPYEWVYCEHRSLGCLRRYLRKNLSHHVENNCQKRQYRCLHCNESGVYDHITDEHLFTCPQFELGCPNSSCDFWARRCDMKKHRLECQYEKVACKYAGIGCKARMDRKDINGHEESMQEHSLVVLETIQKLKEKAEYGEPGRYTPYHFKLTDFDKMKSKQSTFYSKPFYTHPGGYRISIRVDPNGCGEGKGTHVSLFVHIMKGENDDNLPWPFVGSVYVKLFNQLEDRNHHSLTITFKPDDLSNHGSRVMGGFEDYETGWGYDKFMSHSDISHNSSRKCQYLKDDCLYFRVRTRIERGWLFC